MQSTLHLVSDRSTQTVEAECRSADETRPELESGADHSETTREPAVAGMIGLAPFLVHRRRMHRRRDRAAARELLADERGAVTAEYAIVILAAVAFAGLLVAIMRSGEIREMLVQLVQNALGSVN